MTHTLIIGGQTNNFKELYHYTNKPQNEIRPGQYWTDYKTNSSFEAKAMTSSTNHLNYRITIFVNNDLVYDFFSDIATKHGPIGLGMALEYRNKELITFAYLKTDKMS